LSDSHIGAWRDQRLRELNLRSLENAIDIIIKRGIDFLLISGDLFHVNLPDLESVKRVAEKLRDLKDHRIPVYVVYGSHDYSPNATAMIDVLEGGGLLKSVVDVDALDNGFRLNYLTDNKTGAKICGLSGRSYSLEREYYRVIDRQCLEDETGFRIFVLHTAVEEVKPASATYGQGIPVSLLPKGLEYYAGGHIHEYINENVPGAGKIVYPGAIFGSSFTDLEITASGKKKGFVIVDFRDQVQRIEFIENDIIDIVYYELDGEDRTAEEINSDLQELSRSLDPKGKIVLLRLKGSLSSGNISDINFSQARRNLNEKGAEFVFINRRSLSTRDVQRITITGEDPVQIENETLRETLKTFKVPPNTNTDLKNWAEENLKGESGLDLASRLLSTLKSEKQEGETNQDFNTRIVREGKGVLPWRHDS
jgi:DNA repair exonuclease SbcCD nuclease subunit